MYKHSQPTNGSWLAQISRGLSAFKLVVQSNHKIGTSAFLLQQAGIYELQGCKNSPKYDGGGEKALLTFAKGLCAHA